MDVKIKQEIEKRIPLAEFIGNNARSLIVDLFHEKIRTEQKKAHDYVTQLDKEIESMALKAVHQQFPEDGFFGEEHMGFSSKNNIEWVIDPLDGTNNYVRGLPLCGFQIAILYKGVPVYGLIHRPLTQEIYYGLKDEGAFYRNNLTGEHSQLKVSERKLDSSIGIFDAEIGKSGNKSTVIMNRLVNKISMIRVFGVAVFDLPAVAEGSVEFLVSGIAKKYDIAAGSLLIQEAGGHAYSLDGTKAGIEQGLVIYSNEVIKEELLRELAS